MREYLRDVSVYYKGNYGQIRDHINKKLPINESIGNDSYITILDDEYPNELKALQDPPYVLFYEGNINLLRKPKISIVGSRNPSTYNCDVTRKLVMKIKNRYAIVSGLARGIDAISHRSSLDSETIGIIATGLDVFYPQEHKELQTYLCKHQLVLTEYPRGTRAKKHHFPTRNRIIAALGSKVIVTSARLRSGTLCTVNHALSLNREVVVLPHSIFDESGRACNELIQEGASMLTNLDDLSNI